MLTMTVSAIWLLGIQSDGLLKIVEASLDIALRFSVQLNFYPPQQFPNDASKGSHPKKNGQI